MLGKGGKSYRVVYKWKVIGIIYKLQIWFGYAKNDVRLWCIHRQKRHLANARCTIYCSSCNSNYTY